MQVARHIGLRDNLQYFSEAPVEIEDSTRDYLKKYLSKHLPDAFFMEIGEQKF